MDYRMLGRSGAAVSTFALGTMTFGTETDEVGSHAQLDRFLDAGGTLIDTADVYSGGSSEQIIGSWLASRSGVRDQVVLATKGRFRTGDGGNDVGLSRLHLRSALEASLRRLGVDVIDLYQLHAADPLTPPDETLRFLDDAVRAGKIHYVGLSNFTGWQLQRVVDIAEFRGLTVPVTLQPQYNLLVRGIEWEIVPACEAAGLGLLPWSPLGGGWLTGKYERETSPTGATRLGENPSRGMEAYGRRSGVERIWSVVDAVREVAKDRGASMAQVALAWLVDRPAVTSVILGARSVEQLDDNLGAVGVQLSEEERARLDAVSAPDIDDYPYGEMGVEQRDRSLTP
jgi:aryl-alcohol dehydrogenase-like predicted oxidoreductase